MPNLKLHSSHNCVIFICAAAGVGDIILSVIIKKLLGCKQCRKPVETKPQLLNTCAFVMCKLLHRRQTATFDWLKHVCHLHEQEMWEKERKKQTKTKSQSITFKPSDIAQFSEVYIFYTSINPTIAFIYLSCAVPGDWSVSTAQNERKERSVFYICFRFPFGVPVGTTSETPSIGWHALNSLMRNVPTLLFAGV